jgi:hypothetical protein
MYYRVTKFLFSIFVLGILSACSTTDLAYRNNQLVLQVDGKHLQVNSILVDNRINNFGTLHINQQLLQLDDGNMVVYEKARTDDTYEFYFPTIDTIKIVFDARYVQVVYFSSSFYVLQLILNDGRALNVIVEQLEDQSLNMVYGMTNKQINHLLRQLDVTESMPVKQKVITLHHQKNVILSRWTIYKVNVMQLVGPKRDMFGF